MPFKSKAQMRWGNSPAGHAALGDAGVKEFDAATKGKMLPAKVKGEAHSYDSNRPKNPLVSRYKK
jgi:hypothetical protein